MIDLKFAFRSMIDRSSFDDHLAGLSDHYQTGNNTLPETMMHAIHIIS